MFCIDHNLVCVAYFFFFFQKGGSLYERDGDWLMTSIAPSNQIPVCSLIYWQQRQFCSLLSQSGGAVADAHIQFGALMGI